MDYYGRKHSQNFPKIAEEAAAFARDKLSREIKSVPHIKLTKSQLEFILKMPKPMVKRFEHGWGGNGWSFDEDELYQKLMDEKNKNNDIKEMNKEISDLNKKISDLKWLLREIEYIVKKKICDTYQAERKTGDLISHLALLLRKLSDHTETSNFEIPIWCGALEAPWHTFNLRGDIRNDI